MHEALKEMNTLIADAERLFQHMASEGSQCVGDSADKLHRSLRELREGLADLERRARREVGRRIEDADHYVREHPWRTVGLAAAVAFIAGAVLGRRG